MQERGMDDPMEEPYPAELERLRQENATLKAAASAQAQTNAMLRAHGYDVLEAANGSEALRVAQGTARDIHLLVTDVVMPEMGGKELADRLQAARPGIEILYTSGYTDNTIVHHGVLDSGIAFLQKPYSPSALARKVRQVLDQDTGR